MEALRLATVEDCAATLPRLMRTTFSETFGHLYAPSDLEAYLSRAYDPGVLRAELADLRVRMWIVEDGGVAVAYAQAGPCGLPHPDALPSHYELQRIYVRRSHQGRGLGRRLMDVALAWAVDPAPGFTGPLWVGVYSDNTRAQALYSSYGFHKAGEYEFIVGAARDREFIFRRERQLEEESTANAAH